MGLISSFGQGTSKNTEHPQQQHTQKRFRSNNRFWHAWQQITSKQFAGDTEETCKPLLSGENHSLDWTGACQMGARTVKNGRQQMSEAFEGNSYRYGDFPLKRQSVTLLKASQPLQTVFLSRRRLLTPMTGLSVAQSEPVLTIPSKNFRILNIYALERHWRWDLVRATSSAWPFSLPFLTCWMMTKWLSRSVCCLFPLFDGCLKHWHTTPLIPLCLNMHGWWSSSPDVAIWQVNQWISWGGAGGDIICIWSRGRGEV